MGLPSRLELREKLSEALIYHPLLRLLIFDRKFRLFCLVVIGVALLLTISLPKLWRTTPNDFDPKIKISLLDKAQNWSLKRNARKAEAAHDFKQASYSWLAAVRQDPGDEIALRGFLNNFMQIRNPPEQDVQAAVGQIFWLLRLSDTNRADVELSSQVCDQFRWYDMTVQLFSGFSERLPSAAKERFVKALFYQGRFEEFAREFEKCKYEISDPELKLCAQAYKAGWGKGSEALEARQELGRTARQSAGNGEAVRLYMMVCNQRADVAGYAECLKILAGSNEAKALDHANYWKLLAVQGRKGEALELAQGFAGSPASARELLRLAEIYYELGLVDRARDLLKGHVQQYRYSAEVWASYATLLEELKDWNALREAASQIRAQRNRSDALEGFSRYLEGRADLGREGRMTAEIAFRNAAEAKYENPGLGLIVARELMKLKYLEHSRSILRGLEERMAGRDDYWQMAFDCAVQMKDGEWVLKAAEREYQSNPQEIVRVNRYAAALMANRVRPEEAIKLTVQLVSKYPDSSTAMINHALALLMNSRSGEARKQLERVQANELNPFESCGYHLALFEVSLNERDYGRAREESEKIDRQILFPAQVKWLEEKMKELPPRVTGIY